MLFVQLTLQGGSLAAQGFGLLGNGFDSILRPDFLLLALARRLFEFLDAAQHRRALGLETLLKLTGGRQLNAQLVELLGGRFLFARLALRLLHGLGRFAVRFLDLSAAFRDASGQFLRSLLGRFVLLPGAFLLPFQPSGAIFCILQFFRQQPVVGAQRGQFVLLVPNVSAG